jgi:hypothetical protein
LRLKVENGERIYYVGYTTPVPDTLAPIVGDAVHNLRTALDVLVWRLLLAKGGNHPDDKKWKRLYFPIAASAADYRHPTNGHRPVVADGISPLAMNIIDAVEPFKGGAGELLWQLNELANLNKHRLLLTAASGFRGVEMFSLMKGIMPDDKLEGWKQSGTKLYWPQNGLGPFCPLTAGTVIYKEPATDAECVDIDFGFYVSLHEPTIVAPEPLPGFLGKARVMVRGIIASCENLVA